MVSTELLEYVKNYSKLEDDEDIDLLSSFILASKEYLENAGVKFDESKELHKQALAMLTSQRYDDRLGTIKGNNTFIINSLIAQISR
ncbi:MAG TPA: head-tail connector protein [Clostridium perfringens]|nr:head-tail connector protein [Clostridium perfringens]